MQFCAPKKIFNIEEKDGFNEKLHKVQERLPTSDIMIAI